MQNSRPNGWIVYFCKKSLKTQVLTGVDREKMRITAFEVGPGKASVLRKLIKKINLEIIYSR